MNYRPLVLVVFDGFGINTLPGESPMQSAKKPTLDELNQYYLITALQASGLAVGLPWGEEGNSEVGHLTMGAGRVLYHHLPRIIVSIQDGTFFENKVLLEAVEHANTHHGVLHFVGLYSTGSVHAYIDHLYALLDFAKQQNVPKVELHLFGDGRDGPIRELRTSLPQLEERLKRDYPNAEIVSLIGRHFSMDREERWELTQEAYDCLVGRKGSAFDVPKKYIDTSYAGGVTDEFLVPAWKANEKGEPAGRIKDGDAVIFFNFREDSIRQIAHSFLSDKFDKFERAPLSNVYYATLTEYEKWLPAHVAFPAVDVEWPLARVISHANLKQFHIAETEKYAHVTYFFNGGKETPFPGEDRKLIPSARVQFDQKPEMSAEEITQALITAISSYDFILINFANADMVGHTGNFEATVKAIEMLDSCLASPLLFSR
ncbi:MAG: 2,3-bisphosphoglycerate-independent phosphoglycerate mutase [Candidatus Ryanbacteria bacterium]|nr:2,3-bisphosphoglycerate-independent phosphoglycerate mutase [Candidatus Ryanbacteria bacterium]